MYSHGKGKVVFAWSYLNPSLHGKLGLRFESCRPSFSPNPSLLSKLRFLEAFTCTSSCLGLGFLPILFVTQNTRSNKGSSLIYYLQLYSRLQSKQIYSFVSPSLSLSCYDWLYLYGSQSDILSIHIIIMTSKSLHILHKYRNILLWKFASPSFVPIIDYRIMIKKDHMVKYFSLL